MGLKRTDEFRQDAVRIALTSGLTALMQDGRPVCLTLPDHDMGEIVEIAAQALYPQAFAAGRSGKIWRAPEAATSGKTIIALAEGKLRSLLHEGHSVLILTSSEQIASRKRMIGFGARTAFSRRSGRF